MYKMKFKTVIITIIILTLFIISAFTVQASSPRTVWGKVYINGDPAANGILVKLTFSGQEPFANYTYENGNYSFSFWEDNYEEGTFSVYYQDVWYPTIPSIVELGDEDELLYHVDLSVDTTVNIPPNAPILVAPYPSGTTVSGMTSATLQVNIIDPNGDPMDVSFYNANGDSLLSTSSGVASGSSPSYSWSGLTAGTTYNWYVKVDDGEFTVQSATWSFKTASSSGGGGGGTGGGGTSGGGGGNSAPNADAGGPYVGVEDEVITFDGSGSSDSDGEVVDYRWDFNNDGIYDTDWSDSPTATHSYSSAGEYTVKLQVKDNLGGLGDDTAMVEISRFNNAPSIPYVSGPQTGSVFTDYEYTAVSTDADNDTIKYMFDWDDDTNTTTDFEVNGTAVTASHSWSNWGIFTVAVTAFDNQNAPSDTKNYVVLIDVIWVKDIGYLIDTNSDTIYESFYSNETGSQSVPEKQDDGTYLINSDEDSGWDWIYDPETDTLIKYTPPSGEEKEEDWTWLYILFIVIIILLLIAAALMGRKKKTEQKEPEKKSRKSSKTKKK